MVTIANNSIIYLKVVKREDCRRPHHKGEKCINMFDDGY